MPELPEVETTRRGIAPHLTGRTIVEVLVRHPRLRWPVPRGLAARVKGQRIHRVERRAKYLLLRLDTGTLILHLGMSGSLRVLSADSPPGRHDHLDIVLEGGSCLRLTDPRRFGAVLWTTGDPMGHELIRHLGPEPLDDAFDGAYLDERARRRTVPVKQFIMDGEVVVGVGNIYANEALFMAGIHPRRPAGRIARKRYDCLAAAIKAVLNAAIDEGGTTLRDFVNEQGRPGYFSLKLKVYGRAGEPCTACGRPIRQIRQGQRSSFYCASCQH